MTPIMNLTSKYCPCAGLSIEDSADELNFSTIGGWSFLIAFLDVTYPQLVTKILDIGESEKYAKRKVSFVSLECHFSTQLHDNNDLISKQKESGS